MAINTGGFANNSLRDISELPREPKPAPVDLIVFQRVLNLRDVDQVSEWLGSRAAWRRWRTQVRIFGQLHASWARKGLKLARVRMQENSCPLDRQIRDAAEFSWLWWRIAMMAAVHFAGVPLNQQLMETYSRMRAVLATVSAPIPISSAPPPHAA